MTVFGHDPLEAAGILVVIASAIVVGWAVWRSKTAEVAAAAVETWKELAQGYQEKLELRDQQITDMKIEHAAETASLTAQIDDLRRRVEELQASAQPAVLEAIAALANRAEEHEQHARQRRAEQRAEHTEAMAVWSEIRDSLKGTTT